MGPKKLFRSVLEAILGPETENSLEKRVFHAVAFGSAFTSLTLVLFYLIWNPGWQSTFVTGVPLLTMSALYLLGRFGKLKSSRPLIICWVAGAILFIWLDWRFFGLQNGFFLYLLIVYGAVFPIITRGKWLAISLLTLAGVIFGIFLTELSVVKDPFVFPAPAKYVKDRFLGATVFAAALLIVLLIVMRSYRIFRERIAILNDSLIRNNLALEMKNERLEKALQENSALRGIIPVCAKCKKIRDKDGVWNSMEKYIQTRSDASFTHGLCPECLKEVEKSADSLSF